MSVTSSGTFFFFSFWWSLQGFTTEIQIKSAESFLWDGQTENCEWGCSALCCFPRAFLSSGQHVVLLKAHPIKVRDCAHTHPQIPLHQEGDWAISLNLQELHKPKLMSTTAVLQLLVSLHPKEQSGLSAFKFPQFSKKGIKFNTILNHSWHNWNSDASSKLLIPSATDGCEITLTFLDLLLTYTVI